MKREYHGDAIDATITHLSEVEFPGESANANGKVKTELESKDETLLQSRIHELDMMNESISTREIAAELDCDHVYVSEVLNQERGDKYARYRKDNWEEFTHNEKMIIKLNKSENINSRAEIAEMVEVSGAFVTKVLEANKRLFA